MSPEELLNFHIVVKSSFAELSALTNSISFADDTQPTSSQQEDVIAEGLFLRTFTIWENSIEHMFIHYVTGGLTLTARPCVSYLATGDVDIARKIAKGSSKFLSWSKPASIREQATLLLEHGWPVSNAVASNTSDLADCEKIRNRIAHKSPESFNAFREVQRNLFTTEKLFDFSPGQLLRVRKKKSKLSYLGYYCSLLARQLDAVIDPS